jgi:acyl carrier protein
MTHRVCPSRRHLIDDDADLATDLHLSEADLWGIVCEIEEHVGFELPAEAHSRWQTVRDLRAEIEMAGAVL